MKKRIRSISKIGIFLNATRFWGVRINISNYIPSLIRFVFEPYNKTKLAKVEISPTILAKIIHANFSIIERFIYKDSIEIIALETFFKFVRNITRHQSTIIPGLNMTFGEVMYNAIRYGSIHREGVGIDKTALKEFVRDNIVPNMTLHEKLYFNLELIDIRLKRSRYAKIADVFVSFIEIGMENLLFPKRATEEEIKDFMIRMGEVMFREVYDKPVTDKLAKKFDTSTKGDDKSDNQEETQLADEQKDESGGKNFTSLKGDNKANGQATSNV